MENTISGKWMHPWFWGKVATPLWFYLAVVLFVNVYPEVPWPWRSISAISLVVSGAITGYVYADLFDYGDEERESAEISAAFIARNRICLILPVFHAMLFLIASGAYAIK